MRRKILYVLLAGILAISGCSSVISRDIREGATRVTGFSDVRENPDKYQGQTIIIGGVIVNTINHENESTTLVVLAYPLDWTGWPETGGKDEGRFMVKSKEFLDPALYSNGRKVTVAGVVTGIEFAPVGNTKYRYVVMESRQIYLWPRREYYYYYPDYPYHPYWYPHGYYRWP